MRLNQPLLQIFSQGKKEKEINGYKIKDLLTLQSVLIQRMDPILNKLIFMSVMKAFHISNTFNQLNFRPSYYNVLHVSLLLKTNCTLDFCREG